MLFAHQKFPIVWYLIVFSYRLTTKLKQPNVVHASTLKILSKLSASKEEKLQAKIHQLFMDRWIMRAAGRCEGL